MQNAREILQNNNNSIAIDSKAIDLKAIAIEETKADKNKKIEANAIMLMETLKAEPQWLRFFCKCLYQLPEGNVAFILEGARNADYPCRYFCASANRELKKL